MGGDVRVVSLALVLEFGLVTYSTYSQQLEQNQYMSLICTKPKYSPASKQSQDSSYVSCPTNEHKLNPRRCRLRSRSSRIVVIVKELQYNFDIELGLEEGEKSDVVSQCLNESFSSSFALSKRSTG